ncbi:AglZ/HisF2 family acetamidino modification protein [Vibrio cholerae]|uniref:AglZ/HisF2 family acetamidino modification protein n=1 Tax=Vibrio cholerae TaxID=666 RepID=UPI001A28665B|nr:AglZ/HisF2 family acetamidino modification protein [Vibrio cholerae]EGR1913065.1 imidazole glycerol phosphate synthase cyclase subunit [Vibrio cholerae]EGR4325317.1 imidazole glycerol phosphate synthase cyclase subunit [Vibrio cholerae]EHP5030793.1 imidazole glycerol phosphate synthase subunit HisF [Vibrio cholerae]EJL6626434.1 imidazole glycerol phosphate synthase subunit HisF [Vibrio cholerae]EJL6898134.1 imidazole glycerol phosphate synthase subunit HisF [Vibrio cholerae]
MLRSRVSPCLLIHNKGLVKTVKFKDPKYVGDPINAVKIFNEKEVDELIVLDIDATVENKLPDYQMIKYLANESRMPLCYGGGIKTAQQAQEIIKLGVEKVAISSEALSNPAVLSEMADIIGKQSIAVVLDVKKNLLGCYEIYTHNGKKKVKKKFEQVISELEEVGIGELVINSIDQDGMMKGYDMKLAEKVRDLTSVPLTILGGAGSTEDILKLVEKFKVIGASAGSLFVFKGVYKAVLINYLAQDALTKIRKIARSQVGK